MPVDWDGKIRMDCSSPYAMAGLVEMRDRFDLSFANDTDTDRHGIVTPRWPDESKSLSRSGYLIIFSTIVTTGRAQGRRRQNRSQQRHYRSSRRQLGRPLVEVPVGFKWFVDGLIDGSLGFGGEESAGASFLRTNGTVWTTDKDGIILGLLAAEITATTGPIPANLYTEMTESLARPFTSVSTRLRPRTKSDTRETLPRRQ